MLNLLSVMAGDVVTSFLSLRFNTEMNGMTYLTFFLFTLFGLFVTWFVGFLFVWPRNKIRQGLRSLGVALKRISRTVRELERKTFHLSGLLFPFVYHLLLTFITGFEQYHGVIIMTILTSIWIILDFARVYIPFVRRNFPLQSIAREKELENISGVTYFMVGNWIAVTFFPPNIAITSVMFMILGDMSAAIFGISFGKVKIGHKSLEGTLAMFTVCFFIGINMFWDVHMREYPVALGAIAAALIELFEPFNINDNLTIPLLSCLALQFGFHRISTCERKNWMENLSNIEN